MRDQALTYDSSLSAFVRQLFAEPHTLAECYDQAFTPIKWHLKQLAATHPDSLTCMNSLRSTQREGQRQRRRGKTVTRPPRAEIDLILPDRTTLYLGYVITEQQARQQWQFELDSQPDEAERLLLQRRGHLAVKFTTSGCLVPVPRDQLTVAACHQGVHHYLDVVCTPLAGLPIQWLPNKVSVVLYERIWDTARLNQQPYTMEDVDRAIQDEEF